MNLWTLIRRSWTFHWRTHFAVMLGVMIAGAVLSGALVIGDSLRGSLKDLTLQRLDKIEEVLVSPRFFRASLADELSVTLGFHDHFKSAQPAILLRASLEFTNEGLASSEKPSAQSATSSQTNRAGQVQVLGARSEIWQTWEETTHLQTNVPPKGDVLVPPFLGKGDSGIEFVAPKLNQVVLNKTLADELAITPEMLAAKDKDGKPIEIEVLLRLPKPSEIPADSPLGRKNETTRSRRLKVIGIVPNDGFGRFGLLPTQQLVKNAFVNIETLQEIIEQPDKANAIFAIQFQRDLKIHELPQGQSSPDDREKFIEANFKPTLADYGLNLTRNDRGFWQLTSDAMLIEPKVVESLMKSVRSFEGPAKPQAADKSDTIQPSALTREIQASLVYLSNWIAVASDESVHIPYSTIAALDFTDAPPFGPWVSVDGKPIEKLADDEIVLNAWAHNDLMHQGVDLEPGDEVVLTFFEPESTHGETRERRAKFKLRAIVPMSGVSLDRDLTPELKGVTDKDSLANWNPPFPYDPQRVRSVKPHDEDDQYWHKYRTSPKAFINSNAGRQLWSSRFGNTSAIRFAANDSDKKDEIERKILAGLNLKELGLVWQPVKKQGLQASAGTTPFDFLFLGFSMFLIVSALLLVSLLFKLGIDQRARELGIELATGFTAKRLRRLALGEAAGVALVGAILGVVLGVGYGALMVHGLRTWWVAAVVTPFIELHVRPQTLMIGVAATWVVAMLTILWTLRQLRRVDAKRLLAGETAEHFSINTKSRHWIDWARVAAIVAAIALVGIGTQFSGEAQAGAFFGSGMLLLFAALSGLSKYFKNNAHQAQTKIFALGDLARSNAKRSPTRSTLAIGLIAAAVYLVVSISAFRLQPPPNSNDRTQGDGGFPLMGQSDLPIYRDLGDEKTKADFADQISTSDSKEDDKNREAVRASNVIPFRTSGGDDASCLNLYRPRRPRVVAVNDRMIERGGFTWAGSNAKDDEERLNPWRIFERPKTLAEYHSAGRSLIVSPIPVVLDQNTAMYSLQLYGGVGQQFTIEDDDGHTVTLEVAGLLKNSIFQGDLLMHEDDFKRVFPRVSGFNLFLIESTQDEKLREKIGAIDQHTERGWEEALADNGLQIDSTRDRLVSLMAVQNTYLSTFQSLGGLGLILGTLGLAVVQLRSAIERRGELALLQAMGFSRGRIGTLLLRENISLLITGLFIGATLALIAIAPNLWRGDAGIPWLMLAAILGIVIVWGVISGLIASRLALNSPIVETLRRDS